MKIKPKIYVRILKSIKFNRIYADILAALNLAWSDFVQELLKGETTDVSKESFEA